MDHYKPNRIYVERSARHTWVARNVLERVDSTPVELIDDTGSLLEEAKRWNPSVPQGKKSLILARQKGHFFKACPAGRGRSVCCNYFVINYAANCHMECSYCYLQSYLNFPHMVVYANHEDLLGELTSVFQENPRSFFRIGTGELADSLALDSLTSYSEPLVEFFAKQKNAVLELKTKSNCIANLLPLDHRRRTVVAWSINPRIIQEDEEHKTASIEQRFAAAIDCAEAGYKIGFHLDPMIDYPDWEGDYRDLIDEIFNRIPSASIPWISVGTLRVTPELRNIMRSRFPNSTLTLGELVPTDDGKMRYFRPKRVRMYQAVLGWVRRHSKKTAVYLCMEPPGVWSKVFAAPPPSDAEVGDSIVASDLALDRTAIAST